MERSELIEPLVPLIPPPRAHQVRYHGILAPCASLRSRVVPVREFDLGLPFAADGAPKDDNRDAASANASGQPQPDSRPAREGRPDPRPRRLQWAALLHRVFEIDALRCPRCGSTLRLIAAIEDPAIARRILACVGLPARAPPVTPASSHTSSGQDSEFDERWDFDQTPPDDEP
jgi:hypothetical protein